MRVPGYLSEDGENKAAEGYIIHGMIWSPDRHHNSHRQPWFPCILQFLKALTSAALFLDEPLQATSDSYAADGSRRQRKPL